MTSTPLPVASRTTTQTSCPSPAGSTYFLKPRGRAEFSEMSAYTLRMCEMKRWSLFPVLHVADTKVRSRLLWLQRCFQKQFWAKHPSPNYDALGRMYWALGTLNRNFLFLSPTFLTKTIGHLGRRIWDGRRPEKRPSHQATCSPNMLLEDNILFIEVLQTRAHFVKLLSNLLLVFRGTYLLGCLLLQEYHCKYLLAVLLFWDFHKVFALRMGSC